jgi:hypothetical protein
MAVEVIPVPGVRPDAALRAALMASLADETPEGRSIVELARNQGVTAEVPAGATTIPFSATTRQSGLDLDGKSWRKGAVDAVIKTLDLVESQVPAELRQAVDGIARSGGTPLAVSENGALVGVIHLKDVVKPGVKERFADLRRMGVRTVMITGDNPVTAAAIASEAGVDDFLAEATPEDKLRIIRTEQAKGPPRRHVRRRRQRRPCPGPGRCRRRHADRRAGGARGRQHGRSRQRPDQGPGDRRGRQAVADHARRAHHLLDRQRRREILRHHPGAVRRLAAGSGRAQHHGPCEPAERHPLGGDLSMLSSSSR